MSVPYFVLTPMISMSWKFQDMYDQLCPELDGFQLGQGLGQGLTRLPMQRILWALKAFEITYWYDSPSTQNAEQGYQSKIQGRLEPQGQEDCDLFNLDTGSPEQQRMDFMALISWLSVACLCICPWDPSVCSYPSS